MNSRLAKQLIYGGIFFAILFLLVIGVYFRSFRPAPSCFDSKLNQEEEAVDCGGPCISCAIRNLERLNATAELVPVGETVSVVIRFNNPNIFYGAQRFIYTLKLEDINSQELTSITRESFIYPGQFDKTIIEANLPIDLTNIGFDPSIVVSNPEWSSAQEFDQPETSLRQKAVILGETGDKVEVSGVIVNRNAFTLSQVDVGALLYSGKRIVGASKTLLQNIDPFSERFFKIIVPIEEIRVDLEATEFIINARR
jgi:hypothetical protein